MTMIFRVKLGNGFLHFFRIVKHLQIIFVILRDRENAALVDKIANPANRFIRCRDPHLVLEANHLITGQSLDLLPVLVFHDLVSRQYLLVIIDRQNHLGPLQNIKQLIVAMPIIALVPLCP